MAIQERIVRLSFYTHNALCRCRVPQSWCSCAYSKRHRILPRLFAWLADALFWRFEGRDHSRRSWAYYHAAGRRCHDDEVYPFDRRYSGV